MFTCKLNGHKYEFYYDQEKSEFAIRFLIGETEHPHDALHFFSSITDPSSPAAVLNHGDRVRLFKPEMNANFNRWFQSLTKSPCKAVLIKNQIGPLAAELFPDVTEADTGFADPTFMDIENCGPGDVMNYYFAKLHYVGKYSHHGPTIVEIVNGLNSIYRALPFYPRYTIGSTVKVVADTFICGNNIKGTSWCIEEWDRSLNRYTLCKTDDIISARSIPERALRLIKK